MLNKVSLVGRLTRDPEVKATEKSTSGITIVAKFTIAVDRTFKREGQSSADFIPIIVFGKPAENVGKYISKGRLVAVSGRIQTRSWEDQEGKKHYSTEVIADEVDFLDKGKTAEGQNNDSNRTSNPDDNYDGNFQSADEDDDLPF